ncbi:hypothetical protein CAPTEDRAFT_209646 [Capitella teleta]|uniref:Uncharacterized protein n=1 Tax=Capitella teleta TaxID=283909 RepID=R7T5R1_CAPTE|nr:hypothetical protein CAPTEDRAFT_209646 [Capitella teleta]|eukprot:ELT88528.1 hypothetical protein CAPTEDRAFT_209646 [Capitella teleta]
MANLSASSDDVVPQFPLVEVDDDAGRGWGGGRGGAWMFDPRLSGKGMSSIYVGLPARTGLVNHLAPREATAVLQFCPTRFSVPATFGEQIGGIFSGLLYSFGNNGVHFSLGDVNWLVWRRPYKKLKTDYFLEESTTINISFDLKRHIWSWLHCVRMIVKPDSNRIKLDQTLEERKSKIKTLCSLHTHFTGLKIYTHDYNISNRVNSAANFFAWVSGASGGALRAIGAGTFLSRYKVGCSAIFGLCQCFALDIRATLLVLYISVNE